MYGSRSGISPVMATVILVAIAIVIAIAVAFWATGLVGIFTRFEKIETLATAYDSNNNQVELLVRNTGSSPATIDNIYVNGQPISALGGGFGFTNDGVVLDPPTNAPTCDTNSGLCDPGEYVVIQVSEGGTFTWQPGVTYEVAVHTASGRLYPVSVLIP